MRNRKRKWVKEELENCKFFIKNPEENKGHWKEIFEKNQPIHLELGCGKGNFIAQKAKNNLDVNFIAIDLIDDMLGLAKRNVEKVFEENKTSISNLYLTAWNIEQLLKIFGAGDTVERIYINFCNPWPRPRHNKRRLTYPKQLELYKQILAKNGEIHFKTDDMELYKASLAYFKECGFKIMKQTEDLHKMPIFDENIITEHEKMFTEQGILIKALIASL